MTNEELILEKLAAIEARLEGVSRVEQQLAAFAGPWENLRDLGRDLSLLTEPAVQKLTDELVEVESGFQLEDCFVLLKRLLPSLKYLTWSLEQLENLVDWWADMEPLLKLAVPKLIDYLDNLEQKGIFRINGAVLEMYGKIATRYDAADIAAMGDGFVRMHGLVQKLSNPELIQFLEKLVDLPLNLHLEEAKPAGPVGLLWRMRSKECRQGLGVLVELTKALGQLQPAPGSI
ncbi:MAG: DUF1641 domain-containing protein [Syntrophobacterales bacterium]|jgi:uncharacterized protein YjgD (DUF1641 family)|nr:DUF1641 domain-containing protein [Syntrophobacterales bacterium]